jgi:aryl-alcohol dehydrogenase-like predicted oxidoreductase
MKYRPLSGTGVFVSELCLGAMSFGGEGPAWKAIGALDQKTVTELCHRALDAGINFVDTANMYAYGESESLVGKALEGRRAGVILATKVRGRMGEGVNEVGLSRVHIFQQIEASLKRLRTDHVDLYQIHSFDPFTDLSETLRALDDLVRAGKVRYIGCSNLAAWQVMKALGLSRQHGLAEFRTTQNYYSLAGRDLERELVPMISDQKLALLVWSPLAGGFLSGKFTREGAEEGSRRTKFDFPPLDKDRAYKIVDVLKGIGSRHQASVAQTALAWVLAQPAVTTVVIGVKSLAQLDDNLGAVDLTLAPEELGALDEVSRLSPEYPGWMMGAADRMPGKKRTF